jgi:flagellar hook-associated protein 3 FlgL
MTRITSNMVARGVLADIAAANARLIKTQEKLSSGKELNRPSDDPAAVGRALQLRTAMAGAQQHQRNASEAQGWTDVTDSALTSVADALMRVRELTVQGASDAAGPESRKAILEELGGLIDTIKTAGNASYGGRYVFAGTRSDVKPYDMGATDAFAGNTGDIVREIGPGVEVTVNVSGLEAIGTTSTGILGALRTVMDHMATGTGDQISGDLNDLDKQLDNLNAVRAKIGATSNRLDVATARLQEYEGTTLKLLNDTESTDIAKSMIDFSTQQAALTAGLKAGSSIVQNSLLDFLR